MSRFILLASVAVVTAGVLIAAPVPQELPAKALVDGLSNSSEKVRNESAAALKSRVDALPWLRRAARSTDKDTARRAAELVAPYEPKRQPAVAKAIEVCLRDKCLDLFMEWHHYWKPEAEGDLWPVLPRAAQPGLDLLAKSCSKEEWATFDKQLAWFDTVDSHTHNGPCPERFEAVRGAWTIRTDQLRVFSPQNIRYASVAARASLGPRRGGHFLVLGPVHATELNTVFVACDGTVRNNTTFGEFGSAYGITTARAFVVCRGNFTGASTVGASVLLVDGDVDLTRTLRPKNCLIRASGEVRLHPSPNFQPVNCTIETHVKNPTAPYKFFELADVGLSLADDEEGLMVTGVKADTPFGNSGIAKGDLVRAVDDAPVGNSEEVRKLVRRALVRQGDCLVTVVRGDKTFDLPVFFPLPK
jgi:hypothetical protein